MFRQTKRMRILKAFAEKRPMNVMAVLGMIMTLAAMVIWARSIRFGHYALPYIAFSTDYSSFFVHRLSMAILAWAPLLAALSIVAAAFSFGKDRAGWFRRAFAISTVVVFCFSFWVVVTFANGTPLKFF